MIIAQKNQYSKTIIILKDDTWLRVPAGQNPDTYRQRAENQSVPVTGFCVACQFGNHCGGCSCCKKD